MMRCIAIDDEPLALKQLSDYIQRTRFLEWVAGFETAMDALDYLHNHPVELVFVDIQMPGLNGLDFVRSLDRKPLVVFTTAYSEYGVNAYQLDVLDYLLKPIDYPSFLKAANKAQRYAQLIDIGEGASPENNGQLFLRSEYKTVRIDVNDIIYIEGMREYVRVHLENKKPVMSLLSMKAIGQNLPPQRFMRVHRSYIVNLEKIDSVERNCIIIGRHSIQVSDQYKDEFIKYIQARSPE